MSDHKFSLKCIPADDKRQKVESLNYEIKYAEGVTKDIDSFGNIVLNGRIDKPHSEFCVDVEGIVSTGFDVCESIEFDRVQAGKFKYQTALTTPGNCIEAYYEKLKIDEMEDDYLAAHKIMNHLYEDFIYKKEVTNIDTSAEEAMAGGRGVCQDYSHIMLSLLRMKKIPCKYCVGMFIGEGETHAWVEMLAKGYWYGFDPTNNRLIDDDYIKISCGMDAKDCSVNKGIFLGYAKQEQQIHVSVKEQEKEME